MAEAYILFLAFQNKMFFSRKSKGDPANVLLLYHGVAGQGMASFKAFPGPFWALSRPAPRTLLQHWPWEDHATPLREEHSYPEKPISAPDARPLSTDIQMQAWSFPGQWPGRVSTQVFMSYCTEDLVRCKWFHCRNTLSFKHNQCRQDLQKSESTMQTELGQVPSGLEPRSQEAQVRHLGSLIAGHGHTCMWDLGCLFLEEETTPGFHTSPTSGNGTKIMPLAGII